VIILVKAFSYIWLIFVSALSSLGLTAVAFVWALTHPNTTLDTKYIFLGLWFVFSIAFIRGYEREKKLLKNSFYSD
jgi:hypothetical protein